MEIFNNHKTLFWSALILFVFLTLNIAILPAINNQQINKPLPDAKPLSLDEQKGKAIYIENGCVACHTQQVRNIDQDKMFGGRPSISADFAANKRLNVWQNTATLMGTERTGPDLTSIGERQPSKEWQLLHLYQPRAVVAESIMPSYSFLFKEKDYLEKGDVEVAVPEKFLKRKFKKIVATPEALQLVVYLQSLKQVKLPNGTPSPEFLYKPKDGKKSVGASSALPDGTEIYTTNCVSCHQANGEGLPGAFPPLKGSPVVLGDDLELYITIIMKGYDARPQFATMPNVGTAANFTPEMVTALINHERSTWGNNAKPVELEEVKKIMDKIK